MASKGAMILFWFFHAKLWGSGVRTSKTNSNTHRASWDCESNFPVIAHRWRGVLDKGFDRIIHFAGDLQMALWDHPPVHYRDGDLLLLSIHVVVFVEPAGAVVRQLPCLHVEDVGTFPLHLHNVEALAAKVVTRNKASLLTFLGTSNVAHPGGEAQRAPGQAEQHEAPHPCHLLDCKG